MENKELEVKETLTPEQEAEMEADALKEAPDFQINILKDLGIDSEDSDAIEENKELIDRLVKKDVAHFAKTKSITEQKQKQRADKEALKTELDKLKQTPETKPIVSDELVTKKVREEMDREKLNSLNLPEEDKKSIENYAKTLNIPVMEAYSSEYGQFLKSKSDQAKKTEEASIKFSGKSFSTKDFSNIDPSNFDTTTKEGREAAEKYHAEFHKKAKEGTL